MPACIPRIRTVLAVSAAALLLGTSAVSAGESQDPPEPGSTPTETVPPGNGPIDPDDDRGIVHSWSLAPATGPADDPAGARPDLSYELEPGAQAEDAVTLYNFSNEQLTFDLYATDAFNNDSGDFDVLPGTEEATDVGSWITFPQEKLTLPAGTQATFPIAISVPIDVRPGDHAGAVLAASAALGSGPDGRVVTLDRRTGSRVYVRVSGPLEPELAVENLRTAYSPALNPLDGTAEVSYRITNRGNVRLGGSHHAVVSGPFGLLGRSTATSEIEELLPGESVRVTSRIDGVAASGLAFTDVEIVPAARNGATGETEPGSRRSLVLAVPISLLGLLIAAGLAWYARRAYAGHAHDRFVAEPRI